ncbi:hypothetical protein Tco_0182843, partial [Tanacetum coccineum]
MGNIIRVLQVFFLASGLKINVSKSNVYGLGVSPQDVEDMASHTGCGPGTISFSYLGLPLGANMHLTANWQPLIDSYAGFFFLGGSGEIKKMAWVKWENVLASFDKCGMEIWSLKAFNLALLQKWRWRYVNSLDSLWARVVNVTFRIF